MRKNGWRKLGIIMVCMMFLVGLCDCGSGGEQKNANVSATTGVKDVLQAQMEKEDKARKDGQSGEESAANASQGQESALQGGNAGTEAGTAQNAGDGKGASDGSKEANGSGADKAGSLGKDAPQPDVDLTVMSATMVYSEVYQMMYYPETYVGKVIKIKGQYAISEMGDMRYDLCIIKDATACCAQGMEFLLTDAYVYPKDYPEVGDEIELVGTFDTYYEGEYLYCTLRNSTLLAMQ